jgi:hypothetical protein
MRDAASAPELATGFTVRTKAEAFLLAYQAASVADEEGLASREDWRKAWDACDEAAEALEAALDA